LPVEQLGARLEIEPRDRAQRCRVELDQQVRIALEAPLRFRIAQRFAAQITGPWSQNTPVDLLDGAADLVVVSVPAAKEGETERRVRGPDFDALGAAHLVRFHRADDPEQEHDLAHDNPEIVARLEQTLSRHLATLQAPDEITPRLKIGSAER